MNIVVFTQLIAVAFSVWANLVEAKCDPKKFISMMKSSSFSQFGCLDVKLTQKAMEGMKICFKDFVDDIMDARPLTTDKIRKQYGEALKCKYDQLLPLKDGGITGKDASYFYQIGAACVKEMGISAPNDIKTAVQLDLCIGQEIISKCQTLGKDSGAVSFLLAMASMASEEKEACADVNVAASQLVDSYESCLVEQENESTESETAKDEAKGLLSLLTWIQNIPEIKCLTHSYTEMGIMQDGHVNYTKLSVYVEGLEGWRSNKERKLIVDKLKECGEKVPDSGCDYKKDLYFSDCFIPEFVEVCGVTADGLSDYMLPYLNPKIWGKVIDHIERSYHQIRKQLSSLFG